MTLLTKTFAFSGPEKPGSAGGAASAAAPGEKKHWEEVQWSNFQGFLDDHGWIMLDSSIYIYIYISHMNQYNQ